MDNNFECVRCGYNTTKKSNILVHLNKKKKCIKRIESFIYSDEEVMTLSLIRKNNKNNKNNLENTCKHCNKTYTTKWFLTKHMENYCHLSKKDDNEENNKENEKEKEEEKNKIFKTINNNTVNNNNTINNNTINNNIYIINLPNMPISFEKEWDTKHIDMYLKQLLLLTDNKYTELLKQILENKNNLNVIMDKNSEVGYVYDSGNNYKNMEKDEIANLSMKKLHTELNKIKDEVINNSKIHVDIEKEVLTIDNKYQEYVNNKDVQNSVNGHITDIFDQSKKEALEIYNNLNNKENKSKIEGY
jgi:hypothetical protein